MFIPSSYICLGSSYETFRNIAQYECSFLHFTYFQNLYETVEILFIWFVKNKYDLS